MDEFAAARRALEEHPKHDLTLGHRRLILARMGPDGDGRTHQARFDLAVAAARKVLPVFEARFPGNSQPHQAIEMAARWMADGQANWDDWEIAWSEMVEFDGELDEEGQIVNGAGFAAVQTLRSALEDNCVPMDRRVGLTDMDISSEDKDSAFFAAAAFAGSPPWDLESPSEHDLKRWEFWNWWLDAAERSLL